MATADPLLSSLSLISQGAEGRVYRGSLFGRDVVAKERLVKTYRHSELDDHLSRSRISHEARCLHKCLMAGVNVPAVLLVDLSRRILLLEGIAGETAKEYLRVATASGPLTFPSWLAASIGAAVAGLHTLNIVHGDLTTSNIMLRPRTDGAKEAVLIDFGLSYQSSLEEDYAVDLFVLERALIATHPHTESLFNDILTAYAANFTRGRAVLKRLDLVRLRGRKRSMIG